MANTKLLKLEHENKSVFEEFANNREGFANILEELKKVNSKLDNIDREVKKNTEDISQINKTLLDMGKSINNNSKIRD